MRRVLHRVLMVVPTLWLTMSMVFLLILLVPGDPATTIAGENPSPGQVEAIRDQMGLNESLGTQYVHMFERLLIGDLGTSLFSSQTVWSALEARVPVTLSLTCAAIALALLIGIPLGVIAGIRPGSLWDRVATVLATLGMALPSFWLGLILIIVFAMKLGWLPATGYSPITDGIRPWLAYLILPALTLAVNPIAEMVRQLRSSMHEVMMQDYIRTAYSRGLPKKVVVLKHALRNSLIPVLTVLGVQVTNLLGGVVVVEAVFGLPGLGSLAVQSVTTKDLPVTQGVVMFGVLIAMAVNLVVDVLYGFVDPKVKSS